jgi:hypothetical protein
MERDRYLICVVPFLQVSNRASDLCLLSAVKTCRCITLAWPTHRSQIERYFHKLQAHYRISVRLCARLFQYFLYLSLSPSFSLTLSIYCSLSIYLFSFYISIYCSLSIALFLSFFSPLIFFHLFFLSIHLFLSLFLYLFFFLYLFSQSILYAL